MKTFILTTLKRSFWILLTLDTLTIVALTLFGLTLKQTICIMFLGILVKLVATLRGMGLANPKLMEEAEKEDII